MPDLTRESDRLLEQGRALVRDNREGGRIGVPPRSARARPQLKRKT